MSPESERWMIRRVAEQERRQIGGLGVTDGYLGPRNRKAGRSNICQR